MKKISKIVEDVISDNWIRVNLNAPFEVTFFMLFDAVEKRLE